MSKSLLVSLTLMMTELASGSDFADGFASCVQNSNSLNPCLHQVTHFVFFLSQPGPTHLENTPFYSLDLKVQVYQFHFIGPLCCIVTMCHIIMSL